MSTNKIKEYPDAHQETVKKRPSKHNRRSLWLMYFLEPEATYDCRSTFLNKSLSTKAAGYKCSSDNSYQSLGWRIWSDLRPVIEEYFRDQGISELSLKTKLCQLLEARKVLFFSHQGEILASREVPDLTVQLKALKMGLQVMGLLGPSSRVELTGKDGAPLDYGQVMPDEARAILADLIGTTDEDNQ